MKRFIIFGILLVCGLTGLQYANAQTRLVTPGTDTWTTPAVADEQSNLIMAFKLFANSQYDGTIALRFDPANSRVVGSLYGNTYATARLWGYYNKRSLFFLRDDGTKQIWYGSWSWDQKQISGFYIDQKGVVFPWSAEAIPSLFSKVRPPQNFEEPIVFSQSKMDYSCSIDGNGYEGAIDFIILSNRVSGKMSGHASYKDVTVQGVTNGRFMAFLRQDKNQQIWTAAISQSGRLFSGMFFDNNGNGFPWYGEKKPVN